MTVDLRNVCSQSPFMRFQNKSHWLYGCVINQVHMMRRCLNVGMHIYIHCRINLNGTTYPSHEMNNVTTCVI